MVQSVLLVFGVMDIAVDCGVAVNARGVMFGAVSPFDDVRPLQAVRNISSRLIPTHVTDVPGYFLLEYFASLRFGKEEKYISVKLTHVGMTIHINATIIVQFALSFQAVLCTA